MVRYTAPVREMVFAREELLGFSKHYEDLGYADASPELVHSVIEEGAKFAEQVLAPLNRVGDQQGCTLKDGCVSTPDGFKEAYALFVNGGWSGLAASPAWGGQGLPGSLGVMQREMFSQANPAWTMYAGLSSGAMRTIDAHGSDEQKQTYVPKMVSGAWTGTMCLTEAHCGSDVGMLRTRAEPLSDGRYSLTGTKIFITGADHDFAENIVHIVLARLPDAPAGTKGISLFIVPKFLPAPDGSPGERNAVSVGSIEHKMGIHGIPTCVLNFDGATGFLIGQPNRGLNCMFTFMNIARIGTANQGMCAAETAFQGAVRYARERLQGRSLRGPQAPAQPADPIIVHPDVRRLVLTTKAIAEGGRAFMYFCAQQMDLAIASSDEVQRAEAEEMLGLLTPIAKGVLTELAVEATGCGMQVYGGHGYIAETGMEQIMRDARIYTLYEGTTGIQALDLLGRKVLATQGEALLRFTRLIDALCDAQAGGGEAKEFVEPLRALKEEWLELSGRIGALAQKNADEIGAASYDYLMYSGYVVLAYFWALAAQAADTKLRAGTVELGFYRAKLQTARFYFARLLPRTRGHRAAMEAGATSLMDMEAADFLVEA